MDDESSGRDRARVPTQGDLARIARSLNEHGARYAVIGGFALIHHGFARATNDIDLLVDPSPENVERVRLALAILEDQAALEVRPGDLEEYGVTRIADEIVIDLLPRAAGVTLDDVAGEIERGIVEGVPVPYLGPRALLRTKATLREKDALDRFFLERLVAASESR